MSGFYLGLLGGDFYLLSFQKIVWIKLGEGEDKKPCRCRSTKILSHPAGFRNFPIVGPTIIDVVRPATLSKPGSGKHKVVHARLRALTLASTDTNPCLQCTILSLPPYGYKGYRCPFRYFWSAKSQNMHRHNSNFYGFGPAKLHCGIVWCSFSPLGKSYILVL